jgi:hypothetical protein
MCNWNNGILGSGLDQNSHYSNSKRGIAGGVFFFIALFIFILCYFNSFLIMFDAFLYIVLERSGHRVEVPCCEMVTLSYNTFTGYYKLFARRPKTEGTTLHFTA